MCHFPQLNSCYTAAGEWTFYNVHLDPEHWLVERPCSYQSRCSARRRTSLHLPHGGICVHQQVTAFLHALSLVQTKKMLHRN